MTNSKKSVKIGKTENNEPLEESIIETPPISEDDEVIEKPKTKEKRPRTEKQLEAFRKAREKLIEKNEKSKAKKEAELQAWRDHKKILEEKKMKKQERKKKEVYEELETSSEEEEVVVKKKRPKNIFGP